MLNEIFIYLAWEMSKTLTRNDTYSFEIEKIQFRREKEPQQYTAPFSACDKLLLCYHRQIHCVRASIIKTDPKLIGSPSQSLCGPVVNVLL